MFAILTRGAAQAAPLRTQRLIGESEYSQLYAAAEFAESFGLYCDTSVTLAWQLFGIQSDAEVRTTFLAFQKCLRDWLDQRGLPVAFLYGHEHGPSIGLHSHVMVHLPGLPHNERTHRKEFRTWAQAWARRRAGRPVPRGVRVRGPYIETPWLHWRLFGYLCKGYDRSLIVQSGRNAPDGQDVYLGELIPARWQDPGPVTLERRIGCSRSLGPARRALGDPTRTDLTPPEHVLAHTDIITPTAVNVLLAPRWRRLPRPFRSRYEDGVRDVRRLYPPEICVWMQGPAEEVAVPIGPNDTANRLLRTFDF